MRAPAMEPPMVAAEEVVFEESCWVDGWSVWVWFWVESWPGLEVVLGLGLELDG
jgi:hypothetical protein